MKKIIVLSLFICAKTAFSQIQVQSTKKPESSTQGLFVKNGTQKLSSIDCYNFTDLLISFDIDEKFFSYDVVLIQLFKSTSYNEGGFPFNFTFTKEEFARKFKGKKYAYLSLFPDPALDSKSVMGFYRTELQCAPSRKAMDISSVFVDVMGGTRTGERESKIVNGELRFRDVYNYDILAQISVPLHNMIRTGNVTKKPKGDGDCYN